jgi:hypothetical protein
MYLRVWGLLRRNCRSSTTERRTFNVSEKSHTLQAVKLTVSTTNSVSDFFSTLAIIPRDSFSFSFSFSFSEGRRASSALIVTSPESLACFKHKSLLVVKTNCLVLGLLGGIGTWRGRSLLARRRRDLASTVDLKRTSSPSGNLSKEALSRVSTHNGEWLIRNTH